MAETQARNNFSEREVIGKVWMFSAKEIEEILTKEVGASCQFVMGGSSWYEARSNTAGWIPMAKVDKLMAEVLGCGSVTGFVNDWLTPGKVIFVGSDIPHEKSLNSIYFDEAVKTMLHRNHIYSIEQLEGLTREDLLRLDGIGEKRADTILRAQKCTTLECMTG